MVDTQDCFEEPLAQVAAYCGHRPWAELCDLREQAKDVSRIADEVRALRLELAALREDVRRAVGGGR